MVFQGGFTRGIWVFWGKQSVRPCLVFVSYPSLLRHGSVHVDVGHVDGHVWRLLGLGPLYTHNFVLGSKAIIDFGCILAISRDDMGILCLML